MATSKSHCELKTVIFDVGDVLYRWDPHNFLREQIPDAAARLMFINEVDLFNWHETLDAGQRFDKASRELSISFPRYANLIAAWSDNFGEMIKEPIPGTHSIVRDLHRRDVPLFAITNFSADFWRPFHQREYAFFSLFRDVVVSGEVKLLKPDPSIYHLALDRFGISAATTLFIDDRLINVEAAISVGMQGHQFTDAFDLRVRLSDSGLL